MSALLTPGTALPPYRVRAHNAATASENKIHDNDVARQYGFEGGLVPGVTVYAYMTQPVVAAFGLSWLERGTMSARFIKPFYETQWCTVTATVAESIDGAPVLSLEAVNDDGGVCAIGTATLPARAVASPDVSSFAVAPLPSPRPPVSREALEAITVPGTIHETFDPDGEYAQYLSDVPETNALNLGPAAYASSGYLIRRANSALALQVRLNPWIHVSSNVTHHSLLGPGESLETRSRITELFERKGHQFVRMDVLMLGDGERPVMSVDHTAIYDIRKVG
jgi:acyl dehydratase